MVFSKTGMGILKLFMFGPWLLSGFCIQTLADSTTTTSRLTGATTKTPSKSTIHVTTELVKSPSTTDEHSNQTLNGSSLSTSTVASRTPTSSKTKHAHVTTSQVRKLTSAPTTTSNSTTKTGDSDTTLKGNQTTQATEHRSTSHKENNTSQHDSSSSTGERASPNTTAHPTDGVTPPTIFNTSTKAAGNTTATNISEQNTTIHSTGHPLTQTQSTTNVTDSNIETTDNTTITKSFINTTTTEIPFSNSSTYSTSNTSEQVNTTASITSPPTVNVTEADTGNTTEAGLGNLTSTEIDNSTVTQLPNNATSVVIATTTTEKPWQPLAPSGKAFGPNSSNLTVIVVPILAILILLVIAVCIFIMCKRARKASRRTRTPEERRPKNKNEAANQNATGSPFVTSPYRSGQEPSSGHDNFAYEKDGIKTKTPPKYTSATKERTDTQKQGPLQDQELSTDNKSAGYDQLRNDDNKNPKNGLTNNSKYEKLNNEDGTNIELSNIVIESDPDDSNRYFKKADIGDWYRLVMKKKPPKDTEKLIDTIETEGKNGKHRKDKRKHDSENDKIDRNRHRHSFDQKELKDSRRRGEPGSRHKHDNSRDRSHSPNKQRHRSSEHDLNSSMPRASDAKINKDRLTASLPIDASTTIRHTKQSVNTSPTKQSMSPPVKVIMSNPLSTGKSQSASLEKPETLGKRTEKETNFSQAPAPRPRVIMSQPKTTDNVPKVFQAGKPDNRTADAAEKTSTDIKDNVMTAKLQSQKRPESVPRLNLPK